MSVMRFDPFRDYDRLVAEQIAGLRGPPRSVPIDAYRRGDEFLIHLDLPGVDPGGDRTDCGEECANDQG